jgi:hypothetical protein
MFSLIRLNFLTDSLTIFPEFTNYLHYLRTSPGSVPPAHIGKVKQIHTKALPISLCSFIKPLLWNLHPLLPHYFVKKMLLKNISSEISVVVLTGICVFHFSILVSVDPQKCSLAWYTSKHGVAHNLCCILDTWILFLLLCFWENIHGTKFSYIA